MAMLLKRFLYNCFTLFVLFFENFLLRWFLRRPKYNKKYKIAICGIFKNEAPFLKEWIEFHEMIGVEHFYLYNNNSEDDYKSVLQPFIGRGLVTLIEWPYEQAQMKAYSHFYETYRNESQWVSFLDIDEFFCPRHDDSLIDWLRNNDKYPVILVYWKMFGTSGKMKHDNNQLVIEQYTVSWDHIYHTGKCLVNTDYDIKAFDGSTHHKAKVIFPLVGKRFCITVGPVNQFGWFVLDNYHLSWLYNGDKPQVQINHYWSKAWDVYDKKRKMTDVFFKKNPKQEMWYFYAHEKQNRTVDYSMARFFIQFKLKLGLYD